MKTTAVAFAIFLLSFISETYAQFPITYSTPGTYNWTVPVCVTSVRVKVYGAGGGGGGAIAICKNSAGDEACAGAGGGGGGAYSSSVLTVVAGQNYTVTVGGGGAAGSGGAGTWGSGITTAPTSGGTGGNSSFVGNSYNIVGAGGSGGGPAGTYNTSSDGTVCTLSNGSAGSGGVGSGGSTNFNGGNGTAGLILSHSTDKSGGGGGGAGPGGNGGNATAPGSVGITNPPGGVGQTPGGNGGNGWVHNIPSNQVRVGNSGSAYGGAGGGALVHRGNFGAGAGNGGAGANGAVIIEYVAGCLAVDLSSFIASCDQDENKTLIEWTTASESNSDYFLLEKSIDGRDWSSIGKIKSVGNSTHFNDYSFVDEAAILNNNVLVYYRLNQFDFDGVNTIHPVIATQCDFIFDDLTVVPNPASSEIQLLLSEDVHVKSQFEIVDVQGKSLKILNSPEKNSSPVKVQIDDLKKGIYFVKYIDVNGQTKSVRFVKE